MSSELVYDNPKLLIQKLNQLAQEGHYVFRGYSKQDELLPSLIRDSNYTDLEIDFLKEFEKYGSPYFHATTPIDFMSYAQHFGIPTRLLDFTFNPFIALSFALYSLKGPKYKVEEDKDFYYLLVTDLKENYVIEQFTFEKENLVGASKQLDTLCDKSEIIIKCINKSNYYQGFHIKEFQHKSKYNGKILFVDPCKSNQRITMQQGLFMFPYVLKKERHIGLIKNNSTVIAIHKSIRNQLLAYLDTLGFNTYRLMPDLPSVCSAITRNVKEKKQPKDNYKKINLWFSEEKNEEKQE